MKIEERASTHVYRQKQMLSKQELEQVESLCIHEQPAYCVAACPLKLDTKAMNIRPQHIMWKAFDKVHLFDKS